MQQQQLPEEQPQSLEEAQWANQFAWNLYQQIEQGSSNSVVSPYHCSSMLYMMLQGAKGQTQEQMMKALNIPLESIDQVGQIYGKLYGQMKEANMGVELIVSNRIWKVLNSDFGSQFTQDLSNNFGVQIQDMDFKKDGSSNCQKSINAEIARETDQKITECLGSYALNSSSRIVLTSAVAFRGNWKLGFNVKKTERSVRFQSKSYTHQVDMMSMSGERFRMMENQDFQLLELPFAGDRFCMYFLLPKQLGFDPIKDTIKTEQQMSYFEQQLTEQQINIQIPKFKFEGENKLHNNALPNLGIINLLKSKQCELDAQYERNDMHVSEFYQKVYIQVDEQGTSGQKATFGSQVMGQIPIPRKSFIANRPFQFYVKDQVTGVNMIMGRVYKPDHTSGKKEEKKGIFACCSRFI